MNERKSVQKININEIEKRKNFQQCNNMKLNKFSLINIKNKNGITLIALVISIIVMLILAGVSLNATIGDNGIITQAQNATYMQSISALEEYLQTEYIKYYDESEDYTNKIELLSSKIGNLCLKDGTKNYVIYGGKMYYLINKKSLPEELQNQLKGGDTTEYSKYIRLMDVYGVTKDLKVFYSKDGSDSILGTASDLELDPNTPLSKLNSNSEMKSAIEEILSNMGIEVDNERGITVGNVDGVNEITLDGAKNNITSLSGISELSKLKKVTLKNMKLSDLDGIQACTLLNYLYLYNTEIENYNYLAQSLNLQSLYINFENSKFDCNNQIVKLGEGLKNSEISKLNKFGIFGFDILSKTWDSSKGLREDGFSDTDCLRDYVDSRSSKLTDISAISNFSNSIKNSIQYMYLNNNDLTENGGLVSLSGFTNLEYLTIANNKNLTNLDGLENLKLKRLYAQSCNLQTIEGIRGNNNLEVLSIKRNKNLTSLAGIEYSFNNSNNCTNLKELRALECKLNDISALKDSKIEYVSLSSQNENVLYDVSNLQNCNQIKNLYLAGNTNIQESDIILIKNIILACGTNYSLDKKYSLVFLEQAKCNLKDYNLISEQFTLLKNNTNILELDLTNNNNLTNDDFENVLSTCTSIKKLIINSPNLTTINFIKKLPNLWYLDIRGCSNLDDLGVLEELANVKKLNISEILLDNDKIDLAKIQNAMNDIYSRYNYGVQNGIKLYTKNLVKQLENCTELTSIKTYGSGVAKNIDLDLTKLTKLTDVRVCTTRWNMKFPKSLQNYSSDGGNGVHDFSLCENLSRISWSFGVPTNEEFSQMFSTIKNNQNKELTISFGQITFSDGILDLSNLKDSNVKNIEFIISNEFKNSSLKSIITNFDIPNLQKIIINNYFGINNIEFNLLSNLKSLQISNSALDSLDGIRNISTLISLQIANSKLGALGDLSLLSNLEYLTINNNNIGSLNSISTLSSLIILNVSNNSISDLTPLANLRNLQTLNLANNSLENYYFTTNNIDILVNLNKAKLSSLNISGNNFSDTSGLTKLKWKNGYSE